MASPPEPLVIPLRPLGTTTSSRLCATIGCCSHCGVTVARTVSVIELDGDRDVQMVSDVAVFEVDERGYVLSHAHECRAAHVSAPAALRS